MPLDLTAARGLLFRITHVANLPWLLRHGLHAARGQVADPNFVAIGNPDLIDKRTRRVVPLPPGGVVSDYIPFYFTPKSPMLLNIKTGYSGITMRPNEDIAILVSSCQHMAAQGVTMLYTDRHAYTMTAEWRADADDLATLIDWEILRRHDFARSDTYPDKMERYQAEALAHHHVPPAALLGIGCVSDRVRLTIEQAVQTSGAAVQVFSRPRVVFLMIRFTQGNLLEAEAEALVNTVNTVGVSGKGIALMFKEAFPENFRAYQAASKAGQIAPGGLFITERHDMLGPRYIINFATKQHWRHPSKLVWIKEGLEALRREVEARGIRSIAIPPLGAGNGGLQWADVRPLIEEALRDVATDIIVFKPTQTYHNVVKRHGVEKLTPARALMAEMIRRYEILGFDCSMLEAQKLAWFLVGAIVGSGLLNPVADDFAANRYGPYSEKVRHLLNSLDGSYLECERRVADARPFDPIRFRHDRQDRISAYLTTPEASPYRPSLDKASDLIDGFQSPHGLELLATVDWLHKEGGILLDTDAMIGAIAIWPGPERAAERKANIFNRRQVEVAVRHLAGAGGNG